MYEISDSSTMRLGAVVSSTWRRDKRRAAARAGGQRDDELLAEQRRQPMQLFVSAAADSLAGSTTSDRLSPTGTVGAVRYFLVGSAKKNINKTSNIKDKRQRNNNIVNKRIVVKKRKIGTVTQSNSNHRAVQVERDQDYHHHHHHHYYDEQSTEAQLGACKKMSICRTQRCGVCGGCTAKACGHCTYCKDNPQFGGPGVKKQSCVTRRCVRVLESKLHREAANSRARVGCGLCADCLLAADCGACVVCLDRRFFGGQFLPGALCAKKKCSNSRPISNRNAAAPSPTSPHNRRPSGQSSEPTPSVAANVDQPAAGSSLPHHYHYYNYDQPAASTGVCAQFPGAPVRNSQPSLFQERSTTYRRHVDSPTVCPVVYDPLPSPSTIAYHHQLAAQYRLNFRADTAHLWTNNASESNFTTTVYHHQQQQQQQQQHSQPLRQRLTDDLISPLPSVVVQEPIVPLGEQQHVLLQQL
ncbi:Histone-lysine N-methyltransferase 2B [Trichinella zimbabwensis]|uniref:Histone-lysine N-methyltransferase 2B n=1 Tax=Trichinella zimbabwensis TaxID=268475 RepID=A0A0V1IA61_9BILA|nr:Histone-lysine N-methyltransferase 2B [Trichinella zimbabwensis]